MAEQELSSLIKQLQQALSSGQTSAASTLLSKAKVTLLQLNALIPTAATSTPHLQAARETLELGALVSIRQQDPESFTRYFQQLQPFYALPARRLPRERSSESKITGLYLLLLLSQGDYAGFHTLLETLEVAAEQAREKGESANGLEDNAFIQYPIRLEQALMEGSYDRVWGETKSERVPSEEFGVFSEVCG
jgi:26S proteasome regulatory subunit N12